LARIIAMTAAARLVSTKQASAGSEQKSLVPRSKESQVMRCRLRTSRRRVFFLRVFFLVGRIMKLVDDVL